LIVPRSPDGDAPDEPLALPGSAFFSAPILSQLAAMQIAATSQPRKFTWVSPVDSAAAIRLVPAAVNPARAL
jgi:hypothetical protein